MSNYKYIVHISSGSDDPALSIELDERVYGRRIDNIEHMIKELNSTMGRYGYPVDTFKLDRVDTLDRKSGEILLSTKLEYRGNKIKGRIL